MTEVPPRSVEEVDVEAVRAGTRTKRADALAVEEPLEIRIRAGARETSLGLTMRTPGHDHDLAAGLLFSEGAARQRADLAAFEAGRDRDGHPDPNVVVATLHAGLEYDPRPGQRVTLRSSACGICGRATLDDLASRHVPRAPPDRPRVSDAALRGLAQGLRTTQAIFASTGGLHAAALFDAAGRIRLLREDIGRHNAVDKLVGAEFLAGRTPLHDPGLLVSGRAGFEILQKAAVAGVGFVAALGAPSSLAAALAAEFGITLVGFLKPDGYNVYAGPQRILAGR